jgi:hypothetical protein
VIRTEGVRLSPYKTLGKKFLQKFIDIEKIFRYAVFVEAGAASRIKFKASDETAESSKIKDSAVFI